MGKFDGLVIEFDGPATRAYYPGETVSGKVRLDLKRPLSGIKLVGAIKGEARARGTTKTYVDAESDLWNKTRGLKGNLQATLSSGPHVFDFSFALPHDLPSSYESENDKRIRIRYFFKVKLFRRFKENLSAVRPFTVLEYVDVNQSQYLPSRSGEQQTMLGRIFKQGPIVLRGKIDRRGYCPGEGIAIRVKVENHSQKSFSGTTVSLVEYRTIFTNGDAGRKTPRVVCTLFDDESIGPGETKAWTEPKTLQIPLTAPSIMSCDLIQLEHVVELRVNGISHLVTSIPVTLGCVPLRQPSSSSSVSHDKNNGDGNGDDDAVAASDRPPCPLPRADSSPASAVAASVSVADDDSSEDHAYAVVSSLRPLIPIPPPRVKPESPKLPPRPERPVPAPRRRTVDSGQFEDMYNAPESVSPAFAEEEENGQQRARSRTVGDQLSTLNDSDDDRDIEELGTEGYMPLYPFAKARPANDR